MKKIMTIIALMTMAACSYGQSEPKEDLQEKMLEYREKLNLTEEQSEKVDSINAGYLDELSKLKASEESKLAKFRRFKDIQAKKDKQMKEVLDKEQYKQYQAMQAEMKSELKKKRKSQ
ncbi:hypothetical protein [Chitinophaga sp. XS-30]|uniref:hypothetical protein n=1 Tax=Chitinophaga sp. XS-30 TaxID=2604421 RepID=UPI0011DC8E38|nr:hypothetical protein [Chitinophaga sp. XS-30]QEH39941.1 hypothetical protein FW415_03295 [Chitinophaga sp. XS-30]